MKRFTSGLAALSVTFALTPRASGDGVASLPNAPQLPAEARITAFQRMDRVAGLRFGVEVTAARAAISTKLSVQRLLSGTAYVSIAEDLDVNVASGQKTVVSFAEANAGLPTYCAPSRYRLKLADGVMNRVGRVTPKCTFALGAFTSLEVGGAVAKVTAAAFDPASSCGSNVTVNLTLQATGAYVTTFRLGLASSSGVIASSGVISLTGIAGQTQSVTISGPFKGDQGEYVIVPMPDGNSSWGGGVFKLARGNVSRSCTFETALE